MTIAVQISLTGTENNTGTNFNYQCFTQLAADHPTDHFIFVFDSPFEPSVIVHKNITPVLLGPQIKNSLLQHYWYNFKLPRVLNKYNASIFVSSNAACSLRTDAEQIIFINEQTGSPAKQSRYIKKYIPKFFDKAECVIVINNFIKNKLVELHKKHAQKIIAIPPGIDSRIQPFTYEERETVKKKIAGDGEFFVYYDTNEFTETAITVLKAFSLFKKWQLSSMQLVIITTAEKEIKLKKSLSNYKFREHVKLLSDRNTITAAIASSYAALFLPGKKPYEYEILVSMASGVPAIIEEHDYYEGLFGNTAIYTALDERSISEKMMALYKNENRRNHHISAGLTFARSLSWQNIASRLWQTIIPVAAP